MMRLSPLLAAAVLLALLGCSAPFSRPNRPLPAFGGTYLDGRPLVAPGDLLGRPFVINLWVPG